MTRSTATVMPPQAGTYVIDQHKSRIRFTTKHIFGTGTVNGSFSQLSGEIVVADPVEDSHLHVSAAADSFESGDKRRDAKVKTATLLHTAAHPHLDYRSTALVQATDGWRVTGTLTARGGSAPLELRVLDVTSTADGLTIRAEGSVDRYAHGITKMKGLAARLIKLQIEAHATRS